METYELLQQGPGVYMPAIIISLLITLVGYGLFPLVFAKLRKKPIGTKKYTVICYLVNVVPVIIFIVGGSSGGAYILWTFVFSEAGKKMLRKKGILIDKKNKQNISDNKGNETAGMNFEKEEASNSSVSVSEVAVNSDNTECAPLVVEVEDEKSQKKNTPMIPVRESERLQLTAVTDAPEIKFCRKCGFELLQGSKFCSHCGTKIIRM